MDVPVRWDLTTGAVEVLDPYQSRDRSNAYAEDVAAGGDLALSSGVLYRDGEWAALPTPTDGYASLSATDDSGTVITGVFWKEVTQRPMVWRC